MLDIKRVLAAKPKAHEPQPLAELCSPWGEELDADALLQEYPRPQMVRESYFNLNGLWDYAICAAQDACNAWRGARPPEQFDGQILVPFSPETLFSRVEMVLQPDELLWYRRTVTAPLVREGERCLLHFEAVDYACACYCNGVRVGEHVGGYLPFCFDVTQALCDGDELFIELCVFDPSDEGMQLRGKQRLDNGGIWYTPQSGIWQTVWMEVVPAAHIEQLQIDANADEGFLRVEAQVSASGEQLEVVLLDAEEEVARAAGDAACVELDVPEPHVWSPDDPHLYKIEIRYGQDSVASYCAFRTVSIEADEAGHKRFCLNHEPLFLKGVLDQGYWPESLMTAPSDEALVFDIKIARELGFNMIRKHIKVESARWYYHADRLGMLVWQDMITGGGAYDDWHTSYKPTLFSASWSRFSDTSEKHMRALSAGDVAFRKEWLEACEGTIQHLGNHPCVVTWVLFNEGWGQFQARQVTSLVRNMDATRPIDAVSGWFDQRCGDYLSIHNYFRPLEVVRDKAKPKRAFIISEFGGLTLHVDGHSSLPRDYGYAAYESPWEFAAAYAELLEQMKQLEPKGLVGYVYTQLTDIEEETNGLLSYDRRVNKLRAQ